MGLMIKSSAWMDKYEIQLDYSKTCNRVVWLSWQTIIQ